MTESRRQDKEMAKTNRPLRRRRVWRWTGAALLVIGIALLIVRLVLPGYLRTYVNRVLDQNPEYDGRVGEVELSLWRGAYAIRDVDIVKTTRLIPVPFFSSRRVDFAIDWRSLLHGTVRGRVRLEQPKLNFVQGPTADESQSGVHQAWLGMLDELFPFRIDRAEIADGEVHFHAFHTKPAVHAYLADVQATLENLTNVDSKLDPLPATVRATGIAMESGRFKLDMTLDPHSHRPSFSLAARLLGLDVTKLNSLTRAYGDFDFEEGTFDLVAEFSCKNGFLDGYTKPLFRNLRVVGTRDLRTDNVFQLMWESLVGIVGTVFKNQDRNQFGTRITLQGEFDDPKVNMLEVIGNVLYNAFVRAYLPKIEGRVAPDLNTPAREDEPDLDTDKGTGDEHIQG